MMISFICVWSSILFAFFFFKQKTAYEMRISDWSSDVCSSDLGLYLLFGARLNDFSQSPIIGHFKGRRTFEIVLAAIIDGARVVHRLSGTKRLQVQLRLLVVMVVIVGVLPFLDRSEEHTSELQSLMRISYAVFCLTQNKRVIMIRDKSPSASHE